MVPGGTASVLTIQNRALATTLQVETYSSCPPVGIASTPIFVTPGSSMTIPLPSGSFHVHVSGTVGAPYDLTYTPLILLDPCILDGSCIFREIPIIIDDCWVCNNINLDIFRDIFESYRIRLTLPELGLKPDQFTRAFAFRLVTPQGKLIAQGKGNGQEAMLELSTKLPKGSYKLQVSILDQSIAKIIHANNQKYPLKFRFSLVK
jgi:hypothetical protein